MLKAKVHSAKAMDYQGIKTLLRRANEQFPRLRHAPEEVLMRWARELAKEGVAVDWQRLLPSKGFLVLPRRWVVERTFSWIEKNRRMSKDYERLCASGEARWCTLP